jgi:hypothetical protein
VPSVTEEQLRAAYVSFFEFAHVFNADQLGDELHPHIDRDLWPAEAVLMEEFAREFIPFQGSTVSNYWPSELLEAQFWPVVVIDGDEFERIQYGDEGGWGERQPTNCHDCAALPGQLHGPGCDMEECPKCHAQFISCDCDASWAENINQDELIDDALQGEVSAASADTRQYQVPPKMNRDGSQEEWARHMGRCD